MHSESFLNYDVDLSIKLPSEKVGVSSVLALKRPQKNKLKKVEKNCKKVLTYLKGCGIISKQSTREVDKSLDKLV